jgi:ABC-type lipoprotein release transport system permease subunit
MHGMFTVAGLGLRALVAHWRTVVIMALTIALSLAAFLLLSAYRAMSSRYAQLSESFLVAEQNGSIGEFYGSRLPIAAAETLRSAGASLIVPEIHTVTGTTTANAVLLRGVSLNDYSRIESFRILSGQALQPGDPPRSVMVGELLAKDRGAFPGGLIQIRGRDFTVAGIFTIGTYADHEVWMSIADAQELLGWGSDVSIFIVPAGEKLKEGDELPGQIALVRKGESGVNLVKEWVPLFDLFDLVAFSLGIAVAVALANMLWRLAWLRRRDLAILQSLGFGRLVLTAYLFVQAAAIGLLGYLIGAFVAINLSRLASIQTAGVSVQPVFDGAVLAWSLLIAVLISLAGSALPVLWLSRLNLASMLRAENSL